jgi:regulator of protease activity HflC (stomatin/prohibitin superfamily)
MPLDDLKPQTSDKITLQDLDVDIYVQLNTDKAAEIMTRFKGDRERIEHESGDRVGFNFVKRKARETVYDVVSRHASSTIHTERTALAAEIQKDLQARLNAAAPSYFNITSANVRNLVTDPALEANIKAIAVANLNSQAKDREIDVARKEAERKRIEAQGDADAIRVKAEAVNAAGGSGYVQLKAVEKWNGVLPSTNATGSLPFVNVK